MRNPFTPKRAVAGVIAAAVVVGAVAAASARSDSGPTYRTATASMQQVDQVLDAVATVEPVSQAAVAFPVDGTVDAVDVAVGDPVTVGKRLATLDVADLEVTVNEKQAALDQANLTLQLALAGEDVGSVSGGGTPSGGFGRSSAAGTSAEIKAAQQAVLDAQQAVDESSAAAALALENAATVCASTATAAGESTTSTTATATDPSACLAALDAVQVAQQQVSADQAALIEASNALNALLDAEANNPTTPTTTTPVTPSVPNGSNGSGGSNSSSGSDGLPSGSGGSSGSNGTSGSGAASDSGSSSPSAEDLIAYQKKVDAAEDELAVAEQAVDQATIVSPLEGTVASVGLAVGDDVTAGSATQNIVIVGQGGFEVTTSISVKDLPDIEVGQAATVQPDGDHEAVAGEVVRIGVAGDSSGSTTTYPVTIALTGDTSAMGNGSTASVQIVTAAADDALAVPTSAVTVDGDRTTVQVVADGKATTKTVQTGAVGQTWTEITDGLAKGDEVVLADLDEPLPGSATDTSSSSSGQRQGQFPGGGSFTFPGGGAPPSGAGGLRPGN
jgi:HlyD family secretion protein